MTLIIGCFPAAVAQKTVVKRALTVTSTDDDGGTVTIKSAESESGILIIDGEGTSGYSSFKGGEGDKGGEILLQNPPSGSNPDSHVAIINSDLGVAGYDVYIFAQEPAVDRRLKIQNRGLVSEGDNNTFSIIVDGAIVFLENDSSEGDWPAIYAQKVNGVLRLFARDESGNDTVFSPHAAPEELVEGLTQQTSFSDPNYVLPYSFAHKNVLIGKGEVVDMARIVAYVQSKMIEEMGEEEGRVIHTYDLPADEKMSLEDYRLYRRENYMEAVDDHAVWEKVPLGADGKIPSDAFVISEETRPVARVEVVETKEIDYQTERLVTVRKERKITEQVRTGREIKTLKPSYRLVDGELYFCPELENIDARLAEEARFDPPDWVMNRIDQ
jgi:hypothetical protein